MMKHTFDKIKKTLQLLDEMRTVQEVSCTGFHYKIAGYKTDNVIPEVDDTWQKLEGYLPVSGDDIHIWMIGNISIPQVGDSEFTVLEFSDNVSNSSIQTCVYVDGEMIQEFDKNHHWVRLEAGKEYQIGLYHYYTQLNPYRQVHLGIKVISEKIERLYYDMEVPFEVMNVLSTEDRNCRVICNKLEQACNLIDFREPHSETFYDSIENADRYLQREFYDKECGHNHVTVHCIGHSHIDIAWFWTTRQTREKIQRTISMVLKLMDEYPEYRFMLTQPQLFQFLKEEAPMLFEKVKQRVTEGRFEIEGAMWLEADGNLPGGESFIRQILAGKQFIRKEFGKESRLLWIPDVFGYSAALPQILQKFGVDRFVTGKISWNDTNRMPNDTFYWQGIDGSRIFTQFLTTKDFAHPDKLRDYVQLAGSLTAEEIKSSWDVYRNKSYNNEVITTYGYGDGGGGPTREMLERQRRFAHGLPGMPRTKLSSVNEFLDHAQKNFEKSCMELQRTPEWVGELYLEYHRGTYTSMAKNKKKNRQGEFLLHNAEVLATSMMVL